MEVSRLSASAQGVLEVCPSRFKANQIAGRGAELKGFAASVGTTCHFAAEKFVQFTVMEIKYTRDLTTLKVFLMQGYTEVFGDGNYESDIFKECWEMMERWFYRMQDLWDTFKVLSTEQRQQFDVETSRGMRKYTYIFDRFDQLDVTEFRVVDYKTLSAPLSPLQLHDKLQARVYGLAAQIMHPEATRVWVQFDMFRWEGPVGTVFTREQNIETWYRICAAFENGYAIEDKDDPLNPGPLDKKTGQPFKEPPEQLNAECGFCIKKSTCGAVSRNMLAGGVHTYQSFEEMIEARALLDMQRKAAGDAVKELDKNLLAYAEREGKLEINSGLVEGKVKISSTRQVEADKVLEIVGNEMFAKYGGDSGKPSINLGDFDKLLKDPTLDPEKRTWLENLITRKHGDPYIATKLKAPTVKPLV
jgi:hypothetical protein